MQADMEIHSAAKLNAPHLRRDNGTGARSTLHSLPGAMTNSTSGAFSARPEVFEFMLASPRWNSAPVQKIVLECSAAVPSPGGRFFLFGITEKRIRRSRRPARAERA